jgi:hypothetical protein
MVGHFFFAVGEKPAVASLVDRQCCRHKDITVSFIEKIGHILSSIRCEPFDTFPVFHIQGPDRVFRGEIPNFGHQIPCIDSHLLRLMPDRSP